MESTSGGGNPAKQVESIGRPFATLRDHFVVKAILWEETQRSG
jgi:hypothetical protein